MPSPSDQLLLGIATAVAAAKQIPLNPYTVVFLLVGLVFAGWLIVIAMFYGRRSDRRPADDPTGHALTDSSTKASDR